MSDFGISVSATSQDEDPQIFSLNEIYRFVKECMMAVGTPSLHAEAVADCLKDADYTGHPCEGLYQLHSYVENIEHGGCRATAVPSIVTETGVIAVVDGNGGLGVVVGHFSMDLAIKKAKENGIGFVVARGSNSFGMAGVYAVQAVNHGLIGVTFTNSSPLVAPSRAVERALGTNPIAVAAPALDGDRFVLDMATSAVAVGKIEILGRRMLPVPTDWANPKTGALRPLGGHDSTANYKGFGLALFVEIFCGILADAAYGPNVPQYGDTHTIANLAHCFIAISPSHFAPGFEGRLSDLLNYIRTMLPADLTKPVVVPGDIERQHMTMVDGQGGVHLARDLLVRCSQLAERLKVAPLSPNT